LVYAVRKLKSLPSRWFSNDNAARGHRQQISASVDEDAIQLPRYCLSCTHPVTGNGIATAAISKSIGQISIYPLTDIVANRKAQLQDRTLSYPPWC
jgi:hypothetical protein